MKLIASIALSTLSSFSHAETKNAACEQFIRCGTYQVNHPLANGESERREWSFAPESATDVKMMFVIIRGTERSVNASVTLKFATDGSFVAKNEDRTVGFGQCKLSICSVTSWHDDRGYAIASVYRFTGDTVELHKLVVHPDGNAVAMKAVFRK